MSLSFWLLKNRNSLSLFSLHLLTDGVVNELWKQWKKSVLLSHFSVKSHVCQVILLPLTVHCWRIVEFKSTPSCLIRCSGVHCVGRHDVEQVVRVLTRKHTETRWTWATGNSLLRFIQQGSLNEEEKQIMWNQPKSSYCLNKRPADGSSHINRSEQVFDIRLTLQKRFPKILWDSPWREKLYESKLYMSSVYIYIYISPCAYRPNLYMCRPQTLCCHTTKVLYEAFTCKRFIQSCCKE